MLLITLVWAITVAVQYTKIMYRPGVCTVLTYMYRPDVGNFTMPNIPRTGPPLLRLESLSKR